MFFMLVFSCISIQEVLAAPLVDPILSNATKIQASALRPSVLPNGRSTSDILWSCLATIFACTWVSVHPNMPGPKDGRMSIAFRRLELMSWAIVAPEMIIFWAMRQWRGARALVSTYNQYGWTMAHGQFLQMGGFMLAEGDVDIRVLMPDEFRKLLANKEIRFPLTSEKEIQDRSKGDGLSKGLVVVQTSWFIAQCISRKVLHLPISEIELVTVAFAFLNGIMYFFWWSKPVDVASCVRVYRLTSPTPRPQTIDITPPMGTEILIDTIAILGPSPPCIDTPHSTTDLPAKRTPSDNSLSSLTIHQTESSDPGWLPKRAFMFFFRRLDAMRGGGHDSSTSEETRMPIFFASGGGTYGGHFPIAVIAMLFGLIHCTGWFLAFPSASERVLWRTSSVVVSAVPFLVLCSHSIVQLIRTISKRNARRVINGGRQMMATEYLLSILKFPMTIWWIFLIFIPIYLLARLALLIEAFITLRNLPPGAYTVVNWTSYLPHI